MHGCVCVKDGTSVNGGQRQGRQALALHLLLLLESSFGLQDGVFELRPPVNVAAREETQSSRLNAASLSLSVATQ